jgi:integrase/recombinase XerD
MSKKGSVVYQVNEALKSIFVPGISRHELKERGLAERRITGIQTMRDYVRLASQFAKWCRDNYGIREIKKITPGMAEEYLQSLIDAERSGGYIGKIRSAIKKLDIAMRERKIKPKKAPPLISQGGWHSDRRPERAYSEDDALAIISDMGKKARDKQTHLVAMLQLIAGLRRGEASYLRGEDIDPEKCTIRVLRGTKGGQERIVSVDPKHREFLQELKTRAQKHRDGYIFQGRPRLGKRTENAVRHACSRLGLECFSTHGFRKSFAQSLYLKLRAEGLSDREARLRVAKQLGHHRTQVTLSYIPRGLGSSSGSM